MLNYWLNKKKQLPMGENKNWGMSCQSLHLSQIVVLIQGQKGFLISSDLLFEYIEHVLVHIHYTKSKSYEMRKLFDLVFMPQRQDFIGYDMTCPDVYSLGQAIRIYSKNAKHNSSHSFIMYMYRPQNFNGMLLIYAQDLK